MKHAPHLPHVERLQDAIRAVDHAIATATKLRAHLTRQMRAAQAREELVGEDRAILAARVVH